MEMVKTLETGFMSAIIAQEYGMLSRGTPGEIYNFGGDTEITNLDLVSEILKCLISLNH